MFLVSVSVLRTQPKIYFSTTAFLDELEESNKDE